MQLLKDNVTRGHWFVEMSDLTIRVKNHKGSDLMGDYKGNIVADLKPALGITDDDVALGALSPDYPFSYINGEGGGATLGRRS